MPRTKQLPAGEHIGEIEPGSGKPLPVSPAILAATMPRGEGGIGFTDRMAGQIAEVSPLDEFALNEAKKTDGRLIQLRDDLYEVAQTAVCRLLQVLPAETDTVRLIHVAGRAVDVARALTADTALQADPRAETEDRATMIEVIRKQFSRRLE